MFYLDMLIILCFYVSMLQDIESSYRKCGWMVKFMTETAVSDHQGTSKFFTDEDYKNMEFGGGILSPKLYKIATENASSTSLPPTKKVALIKLSEFLKNVVGKRQIPPIAVDLPPTVVMKMDIEGSEVDVMPDLIFNGGLAHINTFTVEWHLRFEKNSHRKVAQSQVNYRKAGLYIQTIVIMVRVEKDRYFY